MWLDDPLSFRVYLEQECLRSETSPNERAGYLNALKHPLAGYIRECFTSSGADAPPVYVAVYAKIYQVAGKTYHLPDWCVRFDNIINPLLRSGTADAPTYKRCLEAMNQLLEEKSNAQV